MEWPTILVALGCWGGWVALLVWHASLPWPLVLVCFALLGGWYMSLQHEVLHGHPTPWPRVNTAIAFLPLSLWLPYRVYRDSHLVHHEVELTAPGIDPESFYVSPEQWEAASPLRRRMLLASRTFVGRLTVGPLLGPPGLVASELRLARNDRSLARMWTIHLVWVAVISAVVFGVADVPVWQYLIGYCFMGMSVTYIRSFVEHLAVAPPATRSAVVRSNWFFGLLFLNNNLHHAHHALPGAAWYRIPRLADEMDAAGAAAAGAGVYRGYGQVIRQYAFRPFSTPVSPMLGAETRP
ncbi:MAG: fatty acid desaturase [Ilumatobacteraceae bacterium]